MTALERVLKHDVGHLQQLPFQISCCVAKRVILCFSTLLRLSNESSIALIMLAYTCLQQEMYVVCLLLLFTQAWYPASAVP